MYQVLYRKWRPQTFDDVVGQPQVTTTLKNELKNGRINHAYLFTGSRGTGKTTCAKIFAKAVNCLDLQNGDPCGKCESCVGIDEGSILDVVEMDAASNRGIADIKSIIDEVQFRPAKAKYRVYIVDEVHMLTTEAFNALLKTLEEPPEHVIFILATTEVHKIPSTILSRCQRFDFNRISPEDITYRLKYVAEQENATISDDAAMLIAAIADGAMRDALSLMDRCLGLTSDIDTDTVRTTAGLAKKDYLFELSAACINKNTEKALDYIDRLHNESKDMARLCDELLDHFRSLMLIKSTRNPQRFIVMSAEEFELAQTQADYLSLAEIIYIMDILQNAYQRMGKGNSNRTELEMALVKLASSELDGSTEALVARVSALEKAIKSGKFVVNTQQNNDIKPIDNIDTRSDAVDNSDVNSEKPEPVKDKSLAIEEEIKSDVTAEKKTIIDTETSTVDEIPLSPAPEVNIQDSEPIVTAPEKPVENVVSSLNLDEIYENAKPFRQWPEVVENIKQYSKAIAAAFSNTNAYESGSYLLIEADSEIPFKLLKEGSQRANVRKAIQEITGKIYKLGPYKKPEKIIKKADPLKELVENLKDSGVNITEE